jgi:hypothetical protein
MKVEIIAAVHWDGHHRESGDVIEVKEWDANWLISRKKAKPYDGTAPIINRVVALETSDQPKLTKRTWKKSSAF